MARAPGKRFYQKPKKKEFVLVFDENARKEFLTGFHKRKLKRKEKAKEELEKKLNIERKKIKAQTKQMYERIIKSQKPVPEVSHLLTEVIDMGEHSVCVTEVSAAAAAKQQNWIGENQVEYYEENNTEGEEMSQKGDVIEGMDIAKAKAEANNLKLKTPKDFKKVLKEEAAQQMKKSKAFKIKSRAAQVKNKKKLRREERKKERQLRHAKKYKQKKKKGILT